MDKINEYHNVIEQIASYNIEIFKRKNKEYGNAFQETVRKYGNIAALTRISDKFRRVEHIILNENKKTSFESLEDSLLDLSNYALMLVYELRNENSNGKK